MRKQTLTTPVLLFKVIFGCLFFISTLVITAHYAIKQTPSERLIETVSETLFYHAIGHAPEDFKEIPQGDFTIQLGVSHSRSKAEQVVSQLKQSGIDAFYTPIILEDRMIYKIRSGWFTSEESAREFSQKLPSHLSGKITQLY